MGRFILIDVAVAGTAFFLWYAWFVRYNRRRAGERAAMGAGGMPGKRPRRRSALAGQQFPSESTLHLSSRWFEDARLTIRLLPRPLPLQWALSRWRRQQETLTFEADMGFPRAFISK